MPILYHYNKCSKSRQALNLLEEKGIDFSIRYYVDNPLNAEEILTLQSKIQVPLINMIRKDEKVFKELFEKRTPSESELLKAIVHHPILLQRPIFENNSQAIIARPPEKLLEII